MSARLCLWMHGDVLHGKLRLCTNNHPPSLPTSPTHRPSPHRHTPLHPRIIEEHHVWGRGLGYLGEGSIKYVCIVAKRQFSLETTSDSSLSRAKVRVLTMASRPRSRSHSRQGYIELDEMPDRQPDSSSWMDCRPPASQPQHQAALRGRFSQRLVRGLATIDLGSHPASQPQHQAALRGRFFQRLVLGLATIDLEQSNPQRLERGRATMNLEQSDAPPEADQREGKSFAKCLNLPTSYDSQLGSQSLL